MSARGGPAADRLALALHGRIVEVPLAAIAAELVSQGPIASLPLVEAIAICARPSAAHPIDRDRAIARLVASLAGAHSGTIPLATLLALVRLDAQHAVPALEGLIAGLAPPLAAITKVASLLLARNISALTHAIAIDDLLAQRAPFVLASFSGAHAEDGLGALVGALLAALARLQPVLGITAYRAFLGDLAEAIFRALQRGADADGLLGGNRELLVDRLCSELGGTPDLVEARGMTWLLGALAPSDDAAKSAIERARARFRDPAFHRDCAAILGELPGVRWPPPPP